jgi:hypothetical protein
MTAGLDGPLGHARIFLAAVCIAASELGAAAVYQASPETYRSLLARLHAGDTLVLAAGEYRDGLPAHRLSGVPDEPIIISGPERGPPATFFARPGHNTVSIVDSHHLVIRSLVLEGNNIAVDAVKAERQSRAAHHVTLEKLTIRGHGNNQQTVGISTKCPAWNWVIREVTIVGAGTGMYLGDSDGSAPFVAGLIERNLIVDTIGYNLQIKHQAPRPDIPGMPEGRSMTIIRHNVFAKPDAGLADSARPNVLVGHFPREGRGAEDDYAIHGNFFYQNRNEALFQGEGNVALYGNLFVNAHGDAVRIQPHNDIPRRVTVAFNTVLAKGAGIVVAQKPDAPRFRQDVFANAVFAGVPLSGAQGLRNLVATLDEASAYLSRPFAPPGELDLRPTWNWAATIPAEALPETPLPDRGQDFDGRPRAANAIGAYADFDTRPGWLPRLERKPGAGRERPGP